MVVSRSKKNVEIGVKGINLCSKFWRSCYHWVR